MKIVTCLLKIQWKEVKLKSQFPQAIHFCISLFVLCYMCWPNDDLKGQNLSLFFRQLKLSCVDCFIHNHYNQSVDLVDV